MKVSQWIKATARFQPVEGDIPTAVQTLTIVFVLCSTTTACIVGSKNAILDGYCTITRPIELYPPYLVSCFLFGNQLPEFKIGSPNKETKE